MSGRFLIPCSRTDSFPNGIEKFRADTLVLPVPSGSIGWNIQSVQQKFRPIRKSKEFCVICKESRYNGPGKNYREVLYERDFRPMRLERCLINSRVLVQVPVKRQQWVERTQDGVLHALRVSAAGPENETVCGKDLPYISNRGTTEATMSMPECPVCLQTMAAVSELPGMTWVIFWVETYLHGRDLKKKLRKTEKEAAAYQRRPSMFDKLLDDTFLDPSTPEPAQTPFQIDPETIDETAPFETDDRLLKVQTRARTAKQFEDDKQSFQQQLKAARKAR